MQVMTRDFDEAKLVPREYVLHKPEVACMCACLALTLCYWGCKKIALCSDAECVVVWEAVSVD